jgi:ribonuclease BN (tRNA processing enzyme)
MRVTILGASPACQNPGGACSGYLIEQDGTALLIDCGSGVFSRLQNYVKPEQVQAILISHMHADHTLDLLPYRYHLFFRAAAQPDLPRPTLLFPPGGHENMLTVSRMQDPSPTFFSQVFAAAEYDPAQTLRVGPLVIEFVPVRHIPHTYAMRVQGRGLFAFSADSGPCEGLSVAARGSDLFLCECANTEESDYLFHLTPRQAGRVATEAGAARLLLTHRWWVHGHERTVAEAGDAFSGPILVAREDDQHQIG